MRFFGVFCSATSLLGLQTLSANAAVMNPQPGLVLTKPDASTASLNTSFLPGNETIPSPTNALPESPYYYHVPDDPAVVIIFYAFAGPIAEIGVVECMLGANQIVSIALAAALRDLDPDRVVPQRYIRTDAPHASLIVVPTDAKLKWITCSTAMKALRAFLNRWEYVRLTFVVREDGVSVGVGELF